MSGKSSKPSKVPDGPPRRIREGVNEWRVQGTKFHIDERYRVIKAVRLAQRLPQPVVGGGPTRRFRRGRALLARAVERQPRPGAQKRPANAHQLTVCAQTPPSPPPQIGHGAYGVVV